MEETADARPSGSPRVKVQGSIAAQRTANSLTLGLVEQLEHSKHISRIEIVIKEPASTRQLAQWDETNFPYQLPDDIRELFMVTNGFQIKIRSKRRRIAQLIGSIRAPSLSGITRLPPAPGLPKSERTEVDQQASVRLTTQNPPHSGVICTPAASSSDSVPNSAAFLLERVPDTGVVALVYAEMRNPTIWFQTRAGTWIYLCRDFTAYFQLQCAHRGIIRWQLLYTPVNIDPQSFMWIRIFAPDRYRMRENWFRARQKCNGSGLDDLPVSIELPSMDRVSVTKVERACRKWERVQRQKESEQGQSATRRRAAEDSNESGELNQSRIGHSQRERTHVEGYAGRSGISFSQRSGQQIASANANAAKRAWV